MSLTLRDQLLGLGFKAPANPEPKPSRSTDARPQRRDERKAHERRDARPANAGNTRKADDRRPRGAATPAAAGKTAARSREDIDLAKAYAIRAQREKEERIAAEAAKQEAARLRREARARLNAFLADKTLNVKDAEIARHFEYGGKIKRVYVTAEQLRSLNAGELGVLQDNGRYLLVTAAVLAEAVAIFPAALALKVDPNAAPGDDPYADPAYQVPDDLVW